MTSKLFEPFRLGPIELSNRIVMAPLTRNRAGAGLVPTPLMAKYYGQRASAGLIISEATQISQQGQGYQDTPGLYSAEQVAGWKPVTEAVHARGGRIFAQLWHVGRVSHVSLQPGGGAPVAPSALTAKTKTFVNGRFVDVSAPRALETAEIPGIIEDYRRAAANALAAGFDGVELHAANGYLIDQFLRDSSNKRTDGYGGPVENRVRLLREAVAALAAEAGADRVGVRLAPTSPANDVADSDPWGLFNAAIDVLNEAGVVYAHIIEGSTGGPRDSIPDFDFAALRARFKGAYVANNGYTPELARQAVDSGAADLIAFGRPFIANPDLVARLQKGLPLAEPVRETLYGGGAEGYTDYPTAA